MIASPAGGPPAEAACGTQRRSRWPEPLGTRRAVTNVSAQGDRFRARGQSCRPGATRVLPGLRFQGWVIPAEPRGSLHPRARPEGSARRDAGRSEEKLGPSSGPQMSEGARGGPRGSTTAAITQMIYSRSCGGYKPARPPGLGNCAAHRTRGNMAMALDLESATSKEKERGDKLGGDGPAGGQDPLLDFSMNRGARPGPPGSDPTMLGGRRRGNGNRPAGWSYQWGPQVGFITGAGRGRGPSRFCMALAGILPGQHGWFLVERRTPRLPDRGGSFDGHRTGPFREVHAEVEPSRNCEGPRRAVLGARRVGEGLPLRPGCGLGPRPPSPLRALASGRAAPRPTISLDYVLAGPRRGAFRAGPRESSGDGCKGGSWGRGSMIDHSRTSRQADSGACRPWGGLESAASRPKHGGPRSPRPTAPTGQNAGGRTRGFQGVFGGGGNRRLRSTARAGPADETRGGVLRIYDGPDRDASLVDRGPPPKNAPPAPPAAADPVGRTRGNVRRLAGARPRRAGSRPTSTRSGWERVAGRRIETIGEGPLEPHLPGRRARGATVGSAPPAAWAGCRPRPMKRRPA